MVDVQTWLGIGFVLVMSVILYLNRSKLEIQKIFGPFLYFAMLKTTWGISLMDWLGNKFRWLTKAFGSVSVVLGFAGMLLITYMLIKSTLMLFISPDAAPGIQPVLPFEAKGVFFVPFIYWIVSIFVIAVIHEFAHGVVARSYNINVKSSGFAFLGALVPIIPAAFVEPDEKDMAKRSSWQQLSVFSAGPGANVIMAIAMVFLLGIPLPFLPEGFTQKTAIVDINELGTNLITFSGLTLNKIDAGSPAETAGLRIGQTITGVNGVPVSDRDNILTTITGLKPGETASLEFGDSTKTLVLGAHPQDPERGYIGIGFDTETAYDQNAIARYGTAGVAILYFLVSLAIWIFILSLGIGLFNLVPLGPIDGGRMLKLILEKITDDAHGIRIWKGVSVAVLGMILVNLVIGFVR